MFKRIKEFFASVINENNNDMLDEIIVSSIDDVLKSKDLYDEMKKTIIKKICEIVDLSLSYSGDAYTTVSKKINSCIVKGIEKSDFSSYTVRMEKVLEDILAEMRNQEGSIVQYAQILENFKQLMCPVDEVPDDEISFEDLFDEYCQFAAERVDTQDEDIKVCYKIHTEESGYDSYEDRFVTFYAEGYEKDGFHHSFALYTDVAKWNGRYAILTIPADKYCNVLRVKDLTWFDIFMLQMKQKFTKIAFDPDKDYKEYDFEIVHPEQEEC